MTVDEQLMCSFQVCVNCITLESSSEFCIRTVYTRLVKGDRFIITFH